MLLVPLGDMYERRGLIVLMTLLSSASLLVSAFAPNITVLMLGTALTGMLSVVAQILVPFAATLALPHERGKAVGTVMSGLLLGILLARTFAGVLADLGSWRTVYWVASLLMLAMSTVLWRVLPRHQSQAGLSYPRLLGSILRMFVDEPLFRARSILGALLFAAFSMLWTPLTFLLSSPPYSYNTTTIGLFGRPRGRRLRRQPLRPAGGPRTGQPRDPRRAAPPAGFLGPDGLRPASVLALLAGILLQDRPSRACMSPIPAASIRCGRKPAAA